MVSIDNRPSVNNMIASGVVATIKIYTQDLSIVPWNEEERITSNQVKFINA